MKEVLEELSPIFKNVFDDDNLIVSPSTKASDIIGWDSLAHIRLIVAIEKNYGIKFSAAEISEIENVGQMVKLILTKRVNS